MTNDQITEFAKQLKSMNEAILASLNQSFSMHMILKRIYTDLISLHLRSNNKDQGGQEYLEMAKLLTKGINENDEYLKQNMQILMQRQQEFNRFFGLS